MGKLFRCALVMMLLLAKSVFAQTPDESAISKLLHATFDRPGAPLTIAPVVVAGNHALAGWIQGDMGGRALLRRKEQSWVLILCARLQSFCPQCGTPLYATSIDDGPKAYNVRLGALRQRNELLPRRQIFVPRSRFGSTTSTRFRNSTGRGIDPGRYAANWCARSSLLSYRGVLPFLSKARESSGRENERMHVTAPELSFVHVGTEF